MTGGDTRGIPSRAAETARARASEAGDGESAREVQSFSLAIRITRTFSDL
jgi:hypothetical protein